MKEMARFLGLWRFNPTAPWPTDPVEAVQLFEARFAANDASLQNGEVEEIGWFLDGKSGYFIASGESKDQFRTSFAAFPFADMEVHEIVPFETVKEVVRGVLKTKAEAMK